nr:hypothetical protein [Tanacetum cinerariifolium]
MVTYDLVDTLMVEKSKLDEDPQGKAVDPTCYCGMIGSLMYLTSSTLYLLCTCVLGISALFALEKRLKIEKCNMRTEFNKPQREPTFQVTPDVLKFSPYYPDFLITAEVPEIYMHQLWNTVKKIKDIDAYQFKLDKQKFHIDTKVFREILQICPRLPNQDFVEPPSEDEMVLFIKDLGYTGKCDMLSKIHTNQMHQPWRTFVVVINSDDESWGESTGTIPGVPDVPKDQSESENKSWGESRDDDDSNDDDSNDDSNDDDSHDDGNNDA